MSQSPRQNPLENGEFIHKIPQILWMGCVTDGITFLSERWTVLTGLSLRQGLGFEFLQAVHPEDRPCLTQSWRQEMVPSKLYETVFRLQQANGQYRSTIAHAQYCPDREAWVGTFTVIEQVLCAPATEMGDRQFVAALLDNLSDGIVACDATGTLTLFNTASQTFHGLPAAPVPANQWAEYYDLYHPDGKTPLQTEEIPLFRALQGETIRGVQMKIVPKQGKPRLLVVSGTPIHHPNGQQLGAVVAMRDITEQEQAEAALRHINVELEARVAQRTAQLEVLNAQNAALLTREREARRDAEAAITQLEVSNCQIEDLLAREQQARMAAEQAIAQVESYAERLTLALDAAQMGTWDWDIVADQTRWSARHELIFGYEPGTPDRNYFDWERRVHPDDLAWIHTATHAARDNHHDLSIQYRILWPDGSLHWIDAQGRFYYDADGTPIRMMGVVRDVTDSKQAEVNLRHSEDRYRSLIEATAQIVWSTNPQGEVVSEQAGWGNFTGQTFEDYRGWGWLQAIHPDDRLLTAHAWAEAIAHHTQYYIEHRLRREDGEYRLMQARGVPVLEPDGTVREWVGAHTDISDRKTIEEALRRSQAQFRATFEQAAVGIAHVTLDGRWARVNQKLCDIVGYSAAELTTLRFQDITHPEDLAADLAIIQQLLAGETQTHVLEKRYLRKSGEPVWVEITASLVREFTQNEPDLTWGTGEPLYFIVVIEDIGDRKQAQAALQERARELSELNRLLTQSAVLLEQRNQELDRFVHIVSHDLKAPLRAISNLSEWIEEDLGDTLPPDSSCQMQLLRSRVCRMESMINGLLHYARAGRTDAMVETVAVDDLLLDVIDSLAPPPTFQIEIAPGMPTLLTKRLLLSQVFANLVGNGIKHHGRFDGNLRIASEDRGDWYEFSVADDGQGIAPEYQDKVFTIFQTAHEQPPEDSSGIGLSIVKKIVESEGGTVWLQSQLGQGTIFFFTWPKTEPHGAKP